ncbi:MAG: hypothetical protein ASARMPRED_003119 [Alectoria sarmentosa]|nr:MAG: hypothetical protein ASARMPRED_003119 [Alectoria sarmentosa]
MTKNYKKTTTTASTTSTNAGSKSKSTSSAEPKSKKSALGKALELFPSPPQSDGTPDPERILEKKRREAAEAAAKDKSGGKK